jgi:BACON domain-containing protein
MILTTLLLRLQQTIQSTTCEWVCFSSIELGLMVLCLLLLTGCGAGGGSAADPVIASPGSGNGHAYGLNPTISLSPTGLAFSATQGGSNPEAQTVTISDSGNGTLNWSVSTTAPWLALSPVSGTAPGSFTVTAIIAGLAAGTYSTTITVTATGATNTPQSIPVDLTIAASTSSTSTSTSTTTTASASLV